MAVDTRLQLANNNLCAALRQVPRYLKGLRIDVISLPEAAFESDGSLTGKITVVVISNAVNVCKKRRPFCARCHVKSLRQVPSKETA